MANNLKLEVILQAIDRATAPIRAVTNSSTGLGRALKESRDQLKALQSTQADVTSFRQAKSASIEQANALQAARNSVRQLSSAIKEQEQTLRPLQARYEQLKADSATLGSQHTTLTQQLRATREQASAANQVWRSNRQRIRELGQQLANTAQPTQALKDEYTALVAQQQRQLSLVKRLSGEQQQLQQQHRASAAKAREQREQLADLSGQLQEARAPMQGLNQDFRTAVRQAQALKTQHTSQQQKLQTLRDKLNAAGISTRNLGEGERELRQRIAQTNKAIGDQEAKLRRLGVQQKRMAAARQQFDKTQQIAGSMAAGGAAGLGTGYAISRPLKGIVDSFAPAENSATQLKVAMMNSTGQVPADFQKISDLATGLGDRLPGTTADFQDMMTMLRRQGISAQSILGGTGEAAAYLGVQLQKPVADAAEFAAKMQDATRSSEKDMMGLMDTIQRAYYLGVDDTNMLQGFSKISPVMDIIKKQGLEAANTFAPLLVMMDQTGMAGESAGNAFRKVFQGAMATDKIDKVLTDLKTVKGIDLRLNFTDGKGEFAGIDNMYKQLDKLKTLTTEDRLSVIKDLFGDDSETLQVLNTMMNKGLAGYEEVAAKMKDQADLRTRVNEQLGTLTNIIEAAEGSWTNAMSEMGKTIAPELKGLINDIGELAVSVKDWVKEHPALAAAILKTAAGLALLLAIGGGITLMLASFLGPFAMVRYALALFGIKSLGAISALKGLGGALLWVGKAILWIGRALMMNPIGLAVMAIATAAYLIYTYWEPIKAFFLGLWEEVKAGFNGGLGGIAKLILDFSPVGLFYRAFAAVMGYFGVELPGKFSDFGSMLLDGLVNGIRNKLGDVKNAISEVGDSTVGWFKEKLGIHSPSRVFAELGGFTMAGLEQGLSDGQKGPLSAVLDLAKQLTAAGALTIGATGTALALDTRPPLSPAGATAGAAAAPPAPIIIQVNAAPGMNEQQLARLVAAEVAKLDSRRQVNARSRLTDKD
ncbi:TPA: phage tail tape measure protein [Pseudomonas aeruginosa]|nr:phage tail tape measure protein [Pseudomonas aeruginosa]